MADPRADFIMPGGQDIHGPAAKTLDPTPPLRGQGMAGKLAEEPDCVDKELCIGIRGAAYFFACHRVPREKTSLAKGAKERERPGCDGYLDAADIGHQLMRL